DHFGRTSAQQHSYLIFQILALLHQAITLGQSLRHSQGPSAWQNRNFVNRIAVLYGQTDGDVTGFVHRRRIAFIFVHHEAFTLGAHQDAVARVLKVFASDRLRIVPRGRDGRLVQNISEIGPGETRRTTRYPIQIEFVIERNVTRVNFQDCFAPAYVSEIHHDLAIESSGPRQGLVEHIGTISRTHDDDAG